MKNKWIHNICQECWLKRHPDRLPVFLKDGYQDTCCYCGNLNFDGIYVREDPKTVPHPEE